MRFLLFLVIVVHALIHLMGFAKAFHFAEISQLAEQPSRTAGLIWLLCAMALTVAGGLFLFKQVSWWWVALPAVILSQMLIFLFWGDAKFGTVANLVILLPITAAALEALPGSYSNRYKTAVREGLARYSEMPLVTEHDLIDLPAPVQKYLHVTGALGKPQIHNFRLCSPGTLGTAWKAPGWSSDQSSTTSLTSQREYS